MKEKLDFYFNKCINDAFKTSLSNEQNRTKTDAIDYASFLEKRKLETSWYYFVVDGEIYFDIKTQSEKIKRMIVNRIKNNVWKNFNLKVGEKYYLTPTIDFNFVCDAFSFKGKRYYLNNMEELEEGIVIPSGRYEKLCCQCYQITIEEFSKSIEKERESLISSSVRVSSPYNLYNKHMDWEKIKSLYRETYEKDLSLPLATAIKSNIVYNGGEY